MPWGRSTAASRPDPIPMGLRLATAGLARLPSCGSWTCGGTSKPRPRRRPAETRTVTNELRLPVVRWVRQRPGPYEERSRPYAPPLHLDAGAYRQEPRLDVPAMQLRDLRKEEAVSEVRRGYGPVRGMEHGPERRP